MFTVEEILKATGGRLISGAGSRSVCGVSIDSRTVRKNELFVAVRGKRFNGHDFIRQAESRGAKAFLVSELPDRVAGRLCKGCDFRSVIKVKNTVMALGALARYHRDRFNIPVIAVTGSNGKTTTKEMLGAILAERWTVLRNPGTQNNQIGVARALLGLAGKHQVAVMEIGTDHPGEIERLSWIVRPGAGIITNIGPSHLEFFKNLKGVFNAKRELLTNLHSGGKIILNSDDRFLSRLNSAGFEKVTFGFNSSSDFSGEIISQEKNRIVFLLNKKQRITLNALGRHNVYNALAAIAAASAFGVSFRRIARALKDFQGPPMRMQMQSVNGIKVINDCYNSNPASLKCALEFLIQYANGTGSRKIVVAGDMLALGREAEELHVRIGRKIGSGGIDFLITVGRLAKHIASGAYSAGMSRKAIFSCADSSQAAVLLRDLVEPEDVVLVKGSRAMQMENVLKCSTISFTR